jgi:hypothetical protein
MKAIKNMANLRNQFPEKVSVILFTIAAAALTVASGCSSDETTGSQSPQVSEIRISPDNTSFEVGEQLDFSVVALSATGDTIDISEIDIEWQWWSTDPDVFTVEAGGLATGQNPGEAYCVVEATVDVSQRESPDIDVMYATIGSGQINQNKAVNRTMTLEAEVAEYYKSESIAMKKRLRFNGRDSAFVVVF